MSLINKHGKILLLGATGLIGNAVGASLTKQGYFIRALFRATSNLNFLSFEPSELIYGNLMKLEDVLQAMQGIDTILYFVNSSVPFNSANDPSREFSNTLPMLLNVLKAAVEEGNARLIFPSTGGAIYGSTQEESFEYSPLAPMSGYALGKALSEQVIEFYARRFGLSFDILRLSNVYGSSYPRKVPQGIIDVFLDNALAGRTSEVWGNLEIERNYIFVDDVANAVATLVSQKERASAIYNIGAPRSHSLKEVLQAIEFTTAGLHRYKCQNNGLQGIQKSILNCSLFQNATGWRPQYSLLEGIKETWMRKLAFQKEAYQSPSVHVVGG